MKITAQKIIETLVKNGYVAYFAGGCVRDLLLGKNPKDYDIVTDALPEKIESLFEKTISIGKKFGVIQILENGHFFEIATFRSDAGYSDGRRPDAVIFSSPEDDANRRDFTINGLFFNPITDEILDFVEGQKDLKEHLIRFIGDPDQRILEDHLRILRAVRFKNQFDFQYDPDTYNALKKHSRLVIDKVSFERIGDEINKILLGPNPVQAFEDLSHLGILEVILPELEALRGLAQPFEYHTEGDVWTHTMNALSSLPTDCSLTLKWATLLHDSGKAETYQSKERIRFDHHCEFSKIHAKNILTRFKQSKKIIDKVSWLVEHHMMMQELVDMNKSRKLHWFHHPNFPELLALFEADAKGTSPTDLSLYNEINSISKQLIQETPTLPKPLLNGNEIMQFLNIPPGPKLAELKTLLLNAQLERTVKTREEAISFLKKNSR